MKLLEYFTQLLNDTVNLNDSRLEDLDNRVVALTEVLKVATTLDGRVLDTVPQGSWAHKTIIRPTAGGQFDADFLVQLSEDLAWNADPQKYNDAIWEALRANGTYLSMTTRKNRCVRVSYANFCHVDVVPYVVSSNGRQVIVNRTENTFEDTNPLGFTAWLQDKDDLTNGNLRKVIRLLKFLRDRRGAFSIRSVLLTTLVGERVNAWRAADEIRYQDVPATLVNVIEDLDSWLQANPWKPHVADPSCPATSFDHRWTDEQYAAFRDDVHKLAPNVRRAYDASAIAESVTGWREVFGSAFPQSLSTKGLSLSGAVKALLSPGPTRAPREEFVEDKFPVDLTHHVSITCEVSDPRPLNRAARRALRQRGSWVPKHRDLLFQVVTTDVPPPYQVHWKVRNQGEEARRLNALRGEIVLDAGRGEKKESTLYSGHHWVECYVVKNGTCLARTREPVIIP